jgi:hypothetical protein
MKKDEANLNQGDFILQSKYWKNMLLKFNVYGDCFWQKLQL